MRMNAYLIFDGNCATAFQFYQSVLGGELNLMKFSDTPACEHVPAEAQSRIMHACLQIGDYSVMASDNTPPHPYEGIKGCSVAIHPQSIEEAKRIFAALNKGGHSIMEMQETFWSPCFGMTTDQFGVSWIINAEVKK
jgi:PhnB protein